MSLENRNPATYEKYDTVVNCVLQSIAIAFNGGKFTPVSYRDYDLKHMLKSLNLRVLRVDSIPTGTMAAEAMVIEFHSFKEKFSKETRKFQIKYNQITNTVGFNFSNEYDRNFDKCVFVYQNDDMEKIKNHIDKVMYDFLLKSKIFSALGEWLEFDEFSERHKTLLSMISI